MRRIKRGTAILLLGVCLLLAAGCTAVVRDGANTAKEKILSGFNEFLQSMSPYALTRDSKLVGERELGEDSYTGHYTADYRDFSGEEILFGGTSLRRGGGHSLTVAYTLEVTAGSASLYWLEKGTRHPIAGDTGTGTYAITLSEGDNYIVLAGKGFSGNLSITAAS